MFIDIHHSGRVVKRFEIPNLPNDPALSWRENVERRQKILHDLLLHFQSYAAPYFKPDSSYALSISFESKLNDHADCISLDGEPEECSGMDSQGEEDCLQ